MEDGKEQPGAAVVIAQGLRAAALGVLANSFLCLSFPVLTQAVNWVPNVTFAVVSIHVMGRLFAAFVERSRTISANTLGAALALIVPLTWLSRMR